MIFSKFEQELLQNSGFIEAKNNINENILNLLNQLGSDLYENRSNFNSVPEEVWKHQYKVSKGENLNRFPYWVLDTPRYFKPDGTFAFRTLIWWGHHISFQFQLEGIYWEKLKQDVKKNWIHFPLVEAKLCTQGSQWNHDHQSAEYKSITQVSPEQLVMLPYFKLVTTVSLDKIEKIQESATRELSSFLKLLNPY